ncbi:hypothetical protein OESDEN_25497 [Oesophagostomum dentatum]|uniref:Uncharacterized protein n=1 Tax=Oesophagostomum dentatum TaxID=61180 RepID=A0A0B1RUQ5_OESDE|nr:hypothetical protein OESDEN_25497 [Oesophagostomum dentatum]
MADTHLMTSNADSPPLNEDIVHIIVEHLATDNFVDDPRVHWTSLVKLNKVFNRVVRRLLARTTKVALEETYRDVRVIISSESTFGRVNPMVSSVSFEKKEPVVSFLRFLARYIDHPITIDIEDYYDHPENDIIVEALSCFPKIDSIIFRRPRCVCRMCCAMVEHAGAAVKIVERDRKCQYILWIMIAFVKFFPFIPIH